MTESSETRQLGLKIPSKEELATLDIRGLHEICRENEQQLLQQIENIGAENIPHLAACGSGENLIKKYENSERYPHWVFYNYEKYSTPIEALRNLYILVFSASRYGFFQHNQPVMGGFGSGIIVYEVEEERAKKIFFSLGKPKSSWEKSAAESLFLHPMPYFCRKPDLSEEGTFYGYVKESLDSETEVEFFSTNKDPGKILATEWFIADENERRIAFYEDNIPIHLLEDFDADKVVNSYRRQMIERLHCQCLVSKILSWLSS